MSQKATAPEDVLVEEAVVRLQLGLTLTDDGYLVDEDGEVVGFQGAPDGLKSEDDALGVLNRLHSASCRMVLATGRRDALKAELTERIDRLVADDPECAVLSDRIANLESMEKDAGRRVAFLTSAYKPWLAEFAAEKLSGTKSRTWKTEYGQVSLRTVPARTVVVDEEVAVPWLERRGEDEAVRRTVLVSRLSAEAVAAATADPVASGIATAPAEEKCDLKVAGLKL